MDELSADEKLYLLAAFRTIPEDWFRPETVGRELALSEKQSETISQALASAGMLTASPGCHARLTEPGRKQAARLAASEMRPRPRRGGSAGAAVNPRIAAAAWLVAFVGLAIALFWLAGIW